MLAISTAALTVMSLVLYALVKFRLTLLYSFEIILLKFPIFKLHFQFYVRFFVYVVQSFVRSDEFSSWSGRAHGSRVARNSSQDVRPTQKRFYARA